VSAEPQFGSELLMDLSERGHNVSKGGPHGHAHAIEVTDLGYSAATDPRAEGAALGL
jgi:gamma-glutamyltranspeptidase